MSLTHSSSCVLIREAVSADVKDIAAAATQWKEEASAIVAEGAKVVEKVKKLSP